MIELKDFISETIKQIAMGIETASKECADYDVIINPNITIGSSGDYCIPREPEHAHIQRRVQSLDMEISVVVSESKEKQGKAQIGISSIGAGINRSNNTQSVNENKVRFSIPICLPMTKLD